MYTGKRSNTINEKVLSFLFSFPSLLQYLFFSHNMSYPVSPLSFSFNLKTFNLSLLLLEFPHVHYQSVLFSPFYSIPTVKSFQTCPYLSLPESIFHICTTVYSIRAPHQSLSYFQIHITAKQSFLTVNVSLDMHILALT